MGYYISMGLSDVKLLVGRVQEAFEALKTYRSGNSYCDEGMQKRIAEALAKVDEGEQTAVEALISLLEDEDFEVRVEGEFLHIDEWNGEKTHEEDYFMAGLGSLFEAGGRSWGSGEQEERWEYRYLGGSYELGWGPDRLYVSKQDKERVRTAFRQLQGPPEALETIMVFLELADVDLDPQNEDKVPA